MDKPEINGSWVSRGLLCQSLKVHQLTLSHHCMYVAYAPYQWDGDFALGSLCLDLCFITQDVGKVEFPNCAEEQRVQKMDLGKVTGNE